MDEQAAGHHRVVRQEFRRAAPTFGERTAGRFDHLGVVAFSRVPQGAAVLEVGAGTGNFLGLFAGVASRLVAVDITPEMLAEARRRRPGLLTVLAEGERLPLRSSSIGLSACAQMIHHVVEPLALLREMVRVTAPGGKVLIVDQIAPDDPDQARALNELEMLRDPSHALSRPAGAYRQLATDAGLSIIDERIAEQVHRFSNWMWAEEFPRERIARVREFIDSRGGETGLDFRKEGDDYTLMRRRIMLLCSTL